VTQWSIETSGEFEKALRKVDRTVVRRVLAFLDDLARLDDPRSRGKSLSGDLAAFWRYRIGDYRLLAEVKDEKLVVVAVRLAHRSSIYDR
jgi:mRNA interferase RelE/StbE